MAFFKFGKASDASAPPAADASSVDELRRRARHRLIGASVLVLVGVLGFPLVFDTQPRPVAVDIPIEIPDRDKVKPLGTPASAAASSPAVSPAASTELAASASAPPSSVASSPIAASAPVSPPAAESKPTAAPPTPAPKVTPSQSATGPASTAAGPKPPLPVPSNTPGGDDAARARALLEGLEPPSRAAIGGASEASSGQGERFIVQVGAYAEVERAREVRHRLEKAGLKTYTHVAETKEGRRIRVRVGPFASRSDAERVAQKVKGLDLPAAILTL